jgi:hypothetical protein
MHAAHGSNAYNQLNIFEITHIFETLIKFCENVKFKNVTAEQSY